MFLCSSSGEFVTAFKHGHFVHLGNAQHITMYFFFGLNGVIDMLLHYRAPLPPTLDYVSAAFAFCMEGVLFLYHLHGRTPMDVQLHMLLCWVVAGCILATVLEMCHIRSVMTRPHAMLLHHAAGACGTWFLQAGFILYPPVGRPWDQNDHGQMMIVTFIFCWHNAAVFVLMLITCLLVHAHVKMLTPTALYRLLHPSTISSSATSSSVTQFSKLDSEQVRRIIDESEEEEV
ncbi:Transmembrane protein 45B [Chionoecetes opilio]|uniref:Transmembrane protein 45B n=1 Tax=Chionoecetes opilio TaxID=41210 RepID=A0A8J5CLI3_CHIOP|nr:Transmembrane protein 45B [Chionoecetes opilio]